MRRLLFISVMLFLICAQGFTQDTQAPGSPAADRVVAAIEVKGNNSISSNTILSKIKTRIGNDFQESIVNEDLKRLYLLGYFSDIKVDTEPYKEGVKVVFIVVERAIIDKISFKGLQFLRMRDDKIKEELKSKETQYLDYPSLMEDVLTLKKLYEKKGFGQAQVDYKVDTDSGKNTAKIQFNIIEGKKVKIRSIKIQGNKSFASKRILKIMKTKRAWFFNAGILKDDVFREDVERVRVFYRRQGYADAVVNYKTETDPARPFLHITIQIEEGKKYAVGKVTILGNRYIKEDEIRAKLKEAIPGKVFSQEAMKEDISGMQGLYFDRGYISMQVYETTSLNPATNQVEIVYNITENQIAYVDKIKIKGNIKTKDVVIRRELRIRPGDKFDGDKLRRSKERLQNLGFFEEISYDTENTPDNNKKDLVVEVKETKTGAFSFGGGYSTVEQFVGFFEISQKNFDWKNFPYFTGDGQDLTFRAALGSVSENFVLSFTEPWMYDYPVSFGFDLYRRTHDRDTDIGYGYNEDVSGGDIRLGKEISEYVKANFMYRYDSIKISGVDETA
ncbi:MAG: outer membrane protein assembly factor BamA, partial [Candidatus Omnitrophica bacterium]|nr:outer membrane protein assembly factor BamA [Candidatus Omnitrophota bacterium]